MRTFEKIGKALQNSIRAIVFARRGIWSGERDQKGSRLRARRPLLYFSEIPPPSRPRDVGKDAPTERRRDCCGYLVKICAVGAPTQPRRVPAKGGAGRTVPSCGGFRSNWQLGIFGYAPHGIKTKCAACRWGLVGGRRGISRRNRSEQRWGWPPTRRKRCRALLKMGDQ